MELELELSRLDQLDEIAFQVLGFSDKIKFFAFFGEMGAGKTTLIKALCKQLGVLDNVSSPTYTLVNEYEIKQGDSVFHFDFYRLKVETDALDIGCEEYFYSHNYCFIEWPEKIPSLIPAERVEVYIKLDKNSRKITLKK